MRQRLDRRLRLLRGKRKTVFDSVRAAAIASAVRGRAQRKVRAWLAQGRPVILVTPRWSLAPRFLDDVALDLQLGRVPVTARVLSVVLLSGRRPHESWGWLIQALREFLGVAENVRLAQAVNREGFRSVVTGLLRRTIGGSPYALLMHGVDSLPVEARDDLLRAFEEHAAEAGPDRRFTLLVASSVDGSNFELEGAARIPLPDFGYDEAIEALAEYVGPCDSERLARIIDVIGGVPALIDRLGVEAGTASRITHDRDAIWRTLGPLAEELRTAVAIASGVDGLTERIDEVAHGAKVIAPVDIHLLRAGLLNKAGLKVSLRAPLFADLSGAR